jgi:energy-coupling factor transporter ATP-binding protein EcfA2/predicted DNA-binding transcriptional regulator AlpA
MVRTKLAPHSLSEQGLVLGLNEHDGKERLVALSTEQRLRHIWVTGSTGSGKSTLLRSMAIQDIRAGNGFAVLDPHGDLVEDILAHIPEERANDVVYFDPADEAYPVGFNVLSAHSELERTLLASDFVAVFRRLSSTTFGDQMVSVLGNAVLAILESPSGGTLLDLRQLLVDRDFRSQFLSTVQDEEVRHYWEHEYPLIKGLPHASILTRLNTFLRPKVLRYMVAQRGSRLDIRGVMDGKKILLAKLSRGLIGDENSHLLGSLLVAKIAQATVSRQSEAAVNRSPFTLYMDKAHNFATPSITDILSGARKYAVSLCFVHHETRQVRSRSEDLVSALLAHAYTRVAFRAGEHDARLFAEGLSFFESRDLQNLEMGQAIARVERPDFDFNLRTLLPETVEASVAKRRREAVRDASRATYAMPRELVEASVRGVSADPSRQPAQRSARPILEVRQPGRGGAQHKYLQSLVRKLGEERGFTVLLEHEVLGGHGYVDAVLERGGLRVACEISVTTRAANELANLTKCLAAGLDHAVLISASKGILERARTELGAGDPRVHFLFPEDLILFLDRFASKDEPAVPSGALKDVGSRRLRIERPEPTAGGNPMLSTRDAARYVGLAVQTLAELRVTGGGPLYHKLGRKVLYEQSELDRWIASRKRRSTSDTAPKAD